MEKIKEKTLKAAIVILLPAIMTFIVLFVAIKWNHPLGETLVLPTQTPVKEDTSLVKDDTKQKTNEVAGTVDSASSLTPTPKLICGGPEYMNILISGVAAEDYLYGLADAIRVARLDFRNQKISVLVLPRDLWVNIPVSVPNKTNQITPGKLNQAYFYGTEGMGYYSGAGKGSGLLAETLQLNFGIHIDHYIAGNLSSFRTLIDTLGGIHVCFAEDVYKKEMDPVTGVEHAVTYIKAGCHTINGEQAEFAVRQRIKIGDEGRIQRQTIVLRAIAAKILSTEGIKALPNLVERLRSYFLLDLSPAEISQLLCLASKIDKEEDVSFATLPETLLTPQRVKDDVRGVSTFAFLPDEEGITNLLIDFQQGLWP